MMRSLLKRMALIVALAVLTGALLHGQSIYYTLWQTDTVNSFELYSPQPIEREFVQQWLQEGKLIVDARSHNDYLDAHIDNAYSVPAGDVQRLNKIVDCCVSREQVVVYCTGFSCSDSFTVGEALYAAGFSEVYLYEGGFADWQQAAGLTLNELGEQQ